MYLMHFTLCNLTVMLFLYNLKTTKNPHKQVRADMLIKAKLNFLGIIIYCSQVASLTCSYKYEVEGNVFYKLFTTDLT